MNKNIEEVSMKDKRSIYIWYTVILLNIGVYITLVFMLLTEDSPTYKISTDPFYTIYGLILLASIIVTALPTFLSQFKSKILMLFSYIVPVIVIVISTIHFYTCTGKFCNLLDIPIIITACAFLAVYILTLLFRKWNKKVVLAVIVFESILLVVGMVVLVYLFMTVRQIEQSIASIYKINIETATPKQVAEICDNVPSFESIGLADFNQQCWYGLVVRFPKINICSASMVPQSKEQCLATVMAEIIQGDRSCQLAYPSDGSFVSNDSKSNEKAKKCLLEYNKIYPELDICGRFDIFYDRKECGIRTSS